MCPQVKVQRRCICTPRVSTFYHSVHVHMNMNMNMNMNMRLRMMRATMLTCKHLS